MRKFLMAVAIVGLALVVAAPAMALDFKFGAEYRIRFFDYMNTGYDHTNFINQEVGGNGVGSQAGRGNARGVQLRVRPRFDVSDDNGNIQATIRFELGDVTWGAGGGANSESLGSNQGGIVMAPNNNRTGNNAGGSIGGDGVALETKWAFVDFAMPFNVPLRVRAGLQPFYLPKGLVIDDDAYGVRAYGSTGIVNYEAFWYRIATAPASASAGAGLIGQPRFDATKDDNFDFYGVRAGLNLAEWMNASAWYMYGDNRANCAQANATTAQLSGTAYITTPCAAGVDRTRPQNWFGIDLVGKVATVDYDLDFVYGQAKGGSQGTFVSGSINYFNNLGTNFLQNNAPIDVRGWAVDGGVHIPIGPFKWNLLFTYASGDKQDGVGSNSSAFPMGPGPSWSGSGGQYELIGEGGAFDVQSFTQHTPTGLWMLGTTLEYTPVKALWLKLAYGFVGFTGKNANCGTATFVNFKGEVVQNPGTQCYGPIYIGKPNDSIAGQATLGQELHLRADYTMWTGFKVQAMAGWFIPSKGDVAGKYILQLLYNF